MFALMCRSGVRSHRSLQTSYSGRRDLLHHWLGIFKSKGHEFKVQLQIMGCQLSRTSGLACIPEQTAVFRWLG